MHAWQGVQILLMKLAAKPLQPKDKTCASSSEVNWNRLRGRYTFQLRVGEACGVEGGPEEETDHAQERVV